MIKIVLYEICLVLYFLIVYTTSRRRRARLEIHGTRVQTRLRSMIFSGRKNPQHKSSGKGFRLGVPSLIFQAR